MTRVVLQRLLESAIALLALSAAAFGLLALMPGDPIDMIAGADPNVTPEDIARLKALYGVDRPFLERWLGWLGRLGAGELGYSRMFAAPVLEILGPALGRTLLLASAAFAISVVVGVFAGVVAALRPRSVFDYAASFLAFVHLAAIHRWTRFVHTA